MRWTSILAIYFLFWVASAFVLLPFGIKTHDELGLDKVPGQADSAPGNFRPGRLAIRATVIAILLTALYVAVGSSRVDLQACKLEYSIVSPK